MSGYISERVEIPCLGERYIGCGDSGREIILRGTAGNALGAYLDGSEITLYGNAQEATGDTMNDGKIIIHGNTGDAAGYAMRGGSIYIKGNAGYRAGIHMKAYKDKVPALVVGGCCGSFLGEYQAGGIIIVLGLGQEGIPVSNFCATGMHGGKMYLRTNEVPADISSKILVKEADENDINDIMPYIKSYCSYFGADIGNVTNHKFYVLSPNSKSPYRQLYCYN